MEDKNVQKKNNTKRILSVIIVAAVLIAALCGLGYLLTPPNFNFHINHELQEIERSGENIDMMFLGASRVYHTFDPAVFEEELGYDLVYNFGAANAPYSATCSQLKNMVDRFRPSRVILGVTTDELLDEEWLRGKMVVWDRLNLPGKLEFMFSGMGLKNWKYAITAYRFRNYLSKEDIRYNLSERKALQEADYKNNEDKNDSGFRYGGNGYIVATESVPEGQIPIDGHREFKEDSINPQAVTWLDTCIKYCQDRNIDVVLVTPPTSMMRIYNIDNYQGVTDYYTRYAAEKGLSYYNLNLLKDRETFLPDTKMCDYNHVNEEGAHLVSTLFAKILKQADQGEDVSDCFYRSVEELKASSQRVAAVGCQEIRTDEADEEGMTNAHLDLISFAPEGAEVEYQIEILSDGKTKEQKDAEDLYEVRIPWTKAKQVELKVPALTEKTVPAPELAKEGDITPEQAEEANKENHFIIKIRARIRENDPHEAVHYFDSADVWNGFDLEEFQKNEGKAANETLL